MTLFWYVCSSLLIYLTRDWNTSVTSDECRSGSGQGRLSHVCLPDLFSAATYGCKSLWISCRLHIWCPVSGLLALCMTQLMLGMVYGQNGQIVYHVLLGRRNIPRPQNCTSCQTGNLGDEPHLVLEYLALQRPRDRYNGLFGDHAATMKFHVAA